METKQCLECQRYFEAKRPTKKYCSDACKQAAYIKRQEKPDVSSANPQSNNTPMANPSLKEYLLQDISAKLAQLISLDDQNKATLQLPGGAKHQVIILFSPVPV